MPKTIPYQIQGCELLLYSVKSEVILEQYEQTAILVTIPRHNLEFGDGEF